MDGEYIGSGNCGEIRGRDGRLGRMSGGLCVHRCWEVRGSALIDWLWLSEWE